MRALEDAAIQRGISLRLVAFSVDPQYDTPPRLKAFAERYQAVSESWVFLTGSPSVVEHTAESFRIAVERSPLSEADPGSIVHGSHTALVDQNLTIRGYYRLHEPAERERLLGDAAGLSHPGSD